MRIRGLLLSIDPDLPDPIYLQLARAVIGALREGRLRPGETLPGTRELAEQLKVHRNTVLQAMLELQAQGWVVMKERAGVFVADPLPAFTPRSLPTPPHPPSADPAFFIPKSLEALSTASTLKMDWSDGVADVRLAPTEAMAKAYQRAMRLKGTELLSSGEFQGQRRLREALAQHVAQHRGMPLQADQLLITRGTPMSLSLVVQALVGPEGGAVAVEDPGLPLVRDTLRQASATVHPIPVDEEGLRTEALAALLESTPLRMLVVSPQAQAPTGVMLSARRREQWRELARTHRFAILELDIEYDHLPGPAMPPKPLAAEEVGDYVRHRLGVAGGDPGIFTPAATDLIARHSGGVPRVINTLCNLSLVYGFARQEVLIDLPVVSEVIHDRMEHGTLPAPPSDWSLTLDGRAGV